MSPTGTAASIPLDRKLGNFASRDTLLSLTCLARTASCKPGKGRALNDPERLSSCRASRAVARSRRSSRASTRDSAHVRVPFENLCMHPRTDSLGPVRSPLAWRASNLCELVSLSGIAAFVRESHPLAIASLVLTRARLLRASSRSAKRLATPLGYVNHDAFDRRLPIISQMRAPAPRWFRFRVEAFASLLSATLNRLAAFAHALRLAHFAGTSSTNRIRGMSVSRRSSRFGGHPKIAATAAGLLESVVFTPVPRMPSL